MKLQQSLLCLLLCLATQRLCLANGVTLTIEERIRQGDVASIKFAADNQRLDLIPALEEANRLTGWHNEPSRGWSQKALAKLGVKKYWDQIVQEFQEPATTEAYRPHLELLQKAAQDPEAERHASDRTRGMAMRKMQYIQHPACVKLVAPWLYESPLTAPGNPSKPQSAVLLFSQLHLPDAPNPTGGIQLGRPEQIQAWQRWWEQHKDYYEKIEFGQPLPPVSPAPPATSQTPPAVKAEPAPAPEPTAKPVPIAPVPFASATSLRPALIALGLLVLAGILVGVLLRAKCR
jgi:hypothetical protein